jgi:hypothetical protein
MGKGLEMKTAWRLIASLVAIAALAVVAATTAAAANPHVMYTCVKEKPNGEGVVSVRVPEPAVSGLTNAGFTCVADADEEHEDPENEDPENDTSGPANGPSVEIEVPQESRSVYCSLNGPAHRANGDGMGIALNLTETQGVHMVEMGLVKPAIFYQGIGASCDSLPGFEDSGVWVDHVGDVVPGVAVYPLFVTA